MPASSDAAPLRRGRFTYVPVVPGRVEFALEVRRAVLRDRPAVIAVELPAGLEKHVRRAVARLPQLSVLVCGDRDDDSRAVYLPIEPADPFMEAVRSGLEIGAEVVFVEPGFYDRPHLPDLYPDPYAARRLGYGRYVSLYQEHRDPRSPEVEAHAAGIAWRVQGADPFAPVMVVLGLNLLDAVLAAMEVPQEPPSEKPPFPEVLLVNPHPDCLAEITTDYPFLQDRYEQYRLLMEEDLIDRPRVQLELLRLAERNYRVNTGDAVAHWQRRGVARFARNLAALGNDLVPGLFDLTVAARSLVDDNFGWEVWDAANRYPAQRDTSNLLGEPETVNLSGEEVWLATRKVRLRRRLPRPKQRLRPRGLKARPKEKRPGEWAESLDSDSICSYPPEDLVVEDYGRFVKKAARTLLTSERERVLPFTTSLLDGVDLRETIRNWHDGRIYVRQLDRMPGDIGSLVVVFDEDRDDRLSYCTTWLGEHQNESDMAFYSTHPFDHMVGPGIGRAEYGGFLMSLPARRMFNVWSDPDYDMAESKPERLLMAALDYSVERNVVYVAARPPRSLFRSLAARMNRKILYIPIGQLSSERLKRVRVVHVLDGHDKRAIAKDYIW